MGSKNKAQAHHTSTYFHTRRVSILPQLLSQPSASWRVLRIPRLTISSDVPRVNTNSETPTMPRANDRGGTFRLKRFLNDGAPYNPKSSEPWPFFWMILVLPLFNRLCLFVFFIRSAVLFFFCPKKNSHAHFLVKKDVS